MNLGGMSLTQKKVIVSSFHTSSPHAIKESGINSDAIVSFDSHIDDMAIGIRPEVIDALKDNRIMLHGVQRAAAHIVFSLFFSNYGLYPDKFRKQEVKHVPIFLINPRSIIESHFLHKRVLLQDEYGDQIPEQYARLFEKPIEEGINDTIIYAANSMGIKIIPSPPADPIVEIRKVLENSKTPVFDIDVDYFTVMHDECFTPRTVNGKPMDNLGNLERVLKLIKKVKPPLITMSEAKMKALEDPNSKTSYLLDSLNNMGYEREDFILVEDDEYAQYLCNLPGEFEKGYHKHLRDLGLSIFSEETNDKAFTDFAKSFFEDKI